MSIQPSRILTGSVSSFDEEIGLGVVTGSDGAEHPFHCTAIADGSRAIPEHTAVSFSLVHARAGRFEARDLLAM